MSTRTFLVCENEFHAELVDQLIAARLREEEGACCNGWSGVYTDGEQYGVLWASPVSDLMGLPEDFPELVLVEDAEDKWVQFVPEAEVP